MEKDQKKKGSITFPNWVIEERTKDIEAAGIVSVLFFFFTFGDDVSVVTVNNLVLMYMFYIYK